MSMLVVDHLPGGVAGLLSNVRGLHGGYSCAQLYEICIGRGAISLNNWESQIEQYIFNYYPTRFQEESKPTSPKRIWGNNGVITILRI
ncbi:unnamed protein product [Calypogeia fissa]